MLLGVRCSLRCRVARKPLLEIGKLAALFDQELWRDQAMTDVFVSKRRRREVVARVQHDEESLIWRMGQQGV